MFKMIKKMFAFTKGFRWMYLFSYFLMTLSVWIAVGNTYLIKVLTNLLIRVEITNPLDLWIIQTLGGAAFLRDHVIVFLLVLLVVALMKMVIEIARGLTRSYLATGLARSNRATLFNHVQRLPYSYLKKMQSGDVIQRVTQDEENIRRFLIGQMFSIYNTALTVIFAGYVLFTQSWELFLIAFSLLPILFIYSYFLIREVRKRYRAVDTMEGQISGVIQENVTATRVVKAYNRESYEIDQFEGKLKDYEKKYYRWRILFSIFFSTSDIFIFAQYGLTLVLGMYWTSIGKIDLGTFTMSLSYVWMIVWPVRDVATMLSNLQRSVVGMERIEELLQHPMEDVHSGLTPDIKGNIELKHVGFKYDDSEEHQLVDINLSIPAGQTVAIMGRTGSGKSTFAALLTRLYDYNEGSITMDGIELRDIAKHHIRRKVATVLQEPFLFSKTIFNNIRLSMKNADEQKVHQAAQIASIHDSIVSFEKGYETPVGERGVSLSGGQKQRIAIARTVIMDAPVLVFDDSLSAVDTDTDLKIREALKDRIKGVTTLLITHRIATAQSADQIIVLDKGRIIQRGTHDELIQQEGLYRTIYDIQSRIN